MVLDNASSDDTVALIDAVGDPGSGSSARRRTWARRRAQPHHRDARGDLVLLLNQDVELDPGFLEAAVRRVRRVLFVGAVQARIRRLDGSGRRSDDLDTTGLVDERRPSALISRGQGHARRPDDLAAGARCSESMAAAPVYRRAAS